jgi:hypothetical protein
VALVVCPCGSVCFDNASVLPLAAQAGGLTLWVKRTDVLGGRYTDAEGVDPTQSVSKFIARWVAERKLDCDPGLVSLRLVHRGPDKLTKVPAERKAAEEAATTLDPEDTLGEAGVVDGSWLLAVMASPGKCGHSCVPCASHDLRRMTPLSRS